MFKFNQQEAPQPILKRVSTEEKTGAWRPSEPEKEEGYPDLIEKIRARQRKQLEELNH